MNVPEYRRLKKRVITAGYSGEIKWAQSIKPPRTAEELWAEYSWVVLNAGMKEQVARKIWNRIKSAMDAGTDISKVFRHKGKTKAIDDAWAKRWSRFSTYRVFAKRNDVLGFCASLPWIGPITKYHLAKNLGAQVAKPDRWLIRIAAETGEDVQVMCKRISDATGDPITVVDTVIWRACNLGFWNTQQ